MNELASTGATYKGKGFEMVEVCLGPLDVDGPLKGHSTEEQVKVGSFLARAQVYAYAQGVASVMPEADRADFVARVMADYDERAADALAQQLRTRIASWDQTY